MSEPWVKVCGLTEPTLAAQVAHAGAHAVGINLCPASPRFVDHALAAQISAHLRLHAPQVERVGVLVDEPLEDLLRLAQAADLTALQLHGDEPPAWVSTLTSQGLQVIKALRIGPDEDAAQVARRADLYREAGRGRCRVLVDARVPGAHGGTGTRLSMALVERLVRLTPVLVAGGLTPNNVAEVAALGPLGVDVASGVEGQDGRKDLGKVAAFLAQARAAWR
jgi:phosphoribosylanthranilate isomerase